MTQPRLRVLCGVSGGVAAIKAPEIVRRLRDRGHEVRCILTRNAPSFVAALPLEVLSGHPVLREEYLAGDQNGRELHIEMGRWADVLCVAPATCNLLAKLALGLADDFLTTTALVFEGPIVAAPAMSSEMWSKSIVQQHVATLRERGVDIVGPVVGALANGEIGTGRMAEPETIVNALESTFTDSDLAGKTVLVTAGPTREPLDPVRFFSNRSTGRMGFSLAAEAASRGARTILIAGPVDLQTPAKVERIDVQTALEMAGQVAAQAPSADLIIMTAAVADFRPLSKADQKIKKSAGQPEIAFEANPDILAGLAQVAPDAMRVGFAAETEHLESEATRKLRDKQAHFIVANDVSRSDIGFASEDNEVTVFAREGEPVVIPRQSKRELARDLLDLFVGALREREADLVTSDQ